MKKYIGITIGPIFETMALTSSPVALWASSYIFSLLAKNICQYLVEDGIEEKNIVSPFYETNNSLLNENDGIGLFHDRIIFVANGYDISKINEIKNKAIERVGESFCINTEYLKKYVMISAAEFEAENPIKESGKILDSLELATPFIDREEENPIISLFAGDGRSKNSNLKEIPIISSLKDFQLQKPNSVNFKTIEEIVCTGTGLKKYNYYAILRSDGDNMSKIIASLSNDEEIRNFSHTCLEYCSAVAKKVKEYGGITIYSGGDDLLAILPCENQKGQTVFNFIKTANDTFNLHFKKYNQPVSLSFGVTISFFKYPLYEALEDSAHLLFDVAKSDKKSRTAIHLQKHSGQSEGLIIPNSKLDGIINLLSNVIENKAPNDDTDRLFLSAVHKISMFKDAFNNVSNYTQLENLFINVFDASIHDENVFLHKRLPEYFVTLKEDTAVQAIAEDEIIEADYALTMCYILRILKFFIEKGD